METQERQVPVWASLLPWRGRELEGEQNKCSCGPGTGFPVSSQLHIYLTLLDIANVLHCLLDL